jgi:hypothetical protein
MAEDCIGCQGPQETAVFDKKRKKRINWNIQWNTVPELGQYVNALQQQHRFPVIWYTSSKSLSSSKSLQKCTGRSYSQYVKQWGVIILDNRN